MLTPAFEQAMEKLQRLTTDKRVGLMWAEAVPWRCHRHLLADAFTVRRWAVRHIVEDRCEAHRLARFARRIGTCIFYPAGGSGGE